tara:strand:- start:1087 stop:1428 length:342 start_codon:yes stop_codon:yes gene_type:complete
MYKENEIKEYFDDFIKESLEYNPDFINENKDDLHHEAFNTDDYIIGRHQAIKWLGEDVFNIIETIKQYELDNFGEVATDLSEPEKIVNMYTYIVGEQIVSDYLNQKEGANNEQ